MAGVSTNKAVPDVAIAVATVLAARRASMVRLVLCGGSIYALTVIASTLLSR
jgi:hypothetical protein